MKKLVLVFISIFVFASMSVAKDITLKFEWQPNSESDLAGYAVYSKVEGQNYNYSSPIKTVGLVTTADVTFPVADNTEQKNYFIIRAFDSNANFSDDSNEVWGDIDLRVPPAPNITAAAYNDTTQTIDFTFDQSNLDLVDKWELYMSNASGGPWTKIADIAKADPPALSTSWQVPGDGDYFFAMVAFRDGSDSLSEDGSQFTSINAGFSPNSNEASAQVKIHPSPNFTFKIKLRVYQ